MDAQTQPAATAKSKRPFYRLHVSTLVLLLPFVVLMGLLIVPGVFSVEAPGFACDHGWPWFYLQRVLVSEETAGKAFENATFNGTSFTFPPGTPAAEYLTAFATGEDPSRNPNWLDGAAWWGPDESREWRPETLAADAAVAALILIGIATIFEWRRRRHTRVWQFSLGELACVIAVIACVLGWWRTNVEESRVEATASDVDNALIVLPGSETIVSAERAYRGPNWLRHLLGANQLGLFERTTAMQIDKWKLKESPAELSGFNSLRSVKINRVFEAKSLAAWLAKMPWIEEVDVCPVRDGGIEILCRTGRLTTLDLGDWLAHSVKDADLEFLSESPKLRKLDLARADVTDKGLERVVELKNLEELILEKTKITDAGVRQLSALKKLTRLSLAQTRVTDEGLRHLSGITGLKKLDLENAPLITDAGMQSLAALKRLELLNLKDTNVSDAGVEKLKAIKSLRELKLRSDQVSPETRQQLQQALPRCKIEF